METLRYGPDVKPENDQKVIAQVSGGFTLASYKSQGDTIMSATNHHLPWYLVQSWQPMFDFLHQWYDSEQIPKADEEGLCLEVIGYDEEGEFGAYYSLDQEKWFDNNSSKDRLPDKWRYYSSKRNTLNHE